MAKKLEVLTGAEIAERSDSFVVVRLNLGPTATKNTVTVEPNDRAYQPFTMEVPRADSLEAFNQPFGYLFHDKPEVRFPKAAKK